MSYVRGFAGIWPRVAVGVGVGVAAGDPATGPVISLVLLVLLVRPPPPR
jgi:hypothetical protein